MKKILYVCFIAICMEFPCRAWAIVGWISNLASQPLGAGDPFTSIVGTVAGLIASFSEPEMGAEVNVTQAEADALQDGKQNVVPHELDGEATSQGFKTTAFGYLLDKYMTGSQKTPYTYFNNKLAGLTFDDAKKLVEERFFVAKAEDLTPEKEQEIRDLRTEYLQTISTEYALTAQDVQQKLVEDFESVISTPFNGSGLLGIISGMDQTWLASTRALMADIALQVQLMELDAARFLSVQPIEILETPAKFKSVGTTTQGGNNS